jgi:hypothetical protein
MDQAVGDLDPLSTSLRQMQVGLRSTGEQTSLYRVPALLAAPDYYQGGTYYYRLGPGFRARVTRLDYLIPLNKKSAAFDITPKYDGVYIDLIPAGAVFELSSKPALSGRPAIPQPPPPRMVKAATPIGAPLDGRIDGRVDGRVDGLVKPPQK